MIFCSPRQDVFYDRNPPGFEAVPLTRYWRFEYMAGLGLAGFLQFCLGVNMLASPWSKQVATQRSSQRWLHHITAFFFSWPLGRSLPRCLLDECYHVITYNFHSEPH